MAPPERRLLGQYPIPGEDGGRAQSDASAPLTAATPVLPRLRDRLNLRSCRPQSLFNPCSSFLLLLLFLRLLVAILVTPNVLKGLLFAIIAILPTIVAGWLVLKHFRDEIVNRPFLLMQFLIGAIPLVILVIPVELIFAIVSAIPVLLSDANEIDGKQQEFLDVIKGGNEQKIMEFYKTIAESIPLPTMILTLVLVAYLSAGLVEEVGKWLVARRFLSLECVCGNDDKRIGARGILASACMAALGFATTENIAYVMAMAHVQTAGFPVFLILMGLFRGVIALPVHIGTQLYVAVSAAHRYVFLDETKVMGALFQAILFHGTFDAIAFVSTLLVGLGRIPMWVGFLVPVIDVVLVSFLLLICRARYKALLERERVASLSEPV